MSPINKPNNLSSASSPIPSVGGTAGNMGAQQRQLSSGGSSSQNLPTINLTLTGVANINITCDASSASQASNLPAAAGSSVEPTPAPSVTSININHEPNVTNSKANIAVTNQQDRTIVTISIPSTSKHSKPSQNASQPAPKWMDRMFNSSISGCRASVLEQPNIMTGGVGLSAHNFDYPFSSGGMISRLADRMANPNRVNPYEFRNR